MSRTTCLLTCSKMKTDPLFKMKLKMLLYNLCERDLYSVKRTSLHPNIKLCGLILLTKKACHILLRHLSQHTWFIFSTFLYKYTAIKQHLIKKYHNKMSVLQISMYIYTNGLFAYMHIIGSQKVEP